MHPLRRALADFGRTLQPWDGFGVNYVETAQTRDYERDPQEYGGLSTLAPDDRERVLDLVFGPQGLRPALVKMFLDPWHQRQPYPGWDDAGTRPDPASYDHETTTRWMRYFVREGLARTRARGHDLSIVTTLYGPPGWMTLQGFVRGRDLDPRCHRALAHYILAWVRHLREQEGLPVDYISLHNEGEDWMRWPPDGSTPDAESHDYNLYWPPEQVVAFLPLLASMRADYGLADVGLAPGEATNWYRFHHYGYADALAQDPAALASLGLITSHGFYGGSYGRWFGDHRSAGIDLLRAARPELHAWTTSTSWSKMDVLFLNELRNQIYAAKVNGIIPWAVIQTSTWVGGDPNPGTAIRVDGRGGYTVEPGYHYYRQVCPVGRAGMRVASVRSNDPTLGLIAFAGGGSAHPDALVLLNMDEQAKELSIEIKGGAERWEATRTSPEERSAEIGMHRGHQGHLAYLAPPLSATTFVAAGS